MPTRDAYDPNAAWLRPYGGSESAGFDYAKILYSLQGYSIDQDTPTVRRAIDAAVWFRAQGERYRWLSEVAVAPPKASWAQAPWS